MSGRRTSRGREPLPSPLARAAAGGFWPPADANAFCPGSRSPAPRPWNAAYDPLADTPSIGPLVCPVERLEPDGTAEPPVDALGPVPEFSLGPLEAVIGMPDSPGPDVLPHHVGLPVGRRQHDGPRPGELEE